MRIPRTPIIHDNGGSYDVLCIGIILIIIMVCAYYYSIIITYKENAVRGLGIVFPKRDYRRASIRVAVIQAGRVGGGGRRQRRPAIATTVIIIIIIHSNNNSYRNNDNSTALLCYKQYLNGQPPGVRTAAEHCTIIIIMYWYKSMGCWRAARRGADINWPY